MSTKWTFLKCANLTQTKGQDFVELDNYREGFSSEVFEIVQRIANSIFKRRKLQLTFWFDPETKYLCFLVYGLGLLEMPTLSSSLSSFR